MGPPLGAIETAGEEHGGREGRGAPGAPLLQGATALRGSHAAHLHQPAIHGDIQTRNGARVGAAGYGGVPHIPCHQGGLLQGEAPH